MVYNTNEEVSTSALLTLVKFADDLALFARLQDENSFAEYFLQLDLLNIMVQGKFSGSKYLTHWRKNSRLTVNKTEKEPFIQVTIDQQSMEAVFSFKYL